MIQSDSGKWLLTDEDIKIRRDDLEMGLDEKITAYIETWFDVDKRFGTATDNSDDYINMYAEYDPTNENLKLIYIVNFANGRDRKSTRLNSSH